MRDVKLSVYWSSYLVTFGPRVQISVANPCMFKVCRRPSCVLLL